MCSFLSFEYHLSFHKSEVTLLSVLTYTSSTGGDELVGLPLGHVRVEASELASTEKGASPSNVKDGYAVLATGEAEINFTERRRSSRSKGIVGALKRGLLKELRGKVMSDLKREE